MRLLSSEIVFDKWFDCVESHFNGMMELPRHNCGGLCKPTMMDITHEVCVTNRFGLGTLELKLKKYKRNGRTTNYLVKEFLNSLFKFLALPIVRPNLFQVLFKNNANIH